MQRKKLGVAVLLFDLCSTMHHFRVNFTRKCCHINRGLIIKTVELERPNVKIHGKKSVATNLFTFNGAEIKDVKQAITQYFEDCFETA